MANFSFFGRGAYLVVLFVFFETSLTGPSATRKNWAPVFPQQLELLSEKRWPNFPLLAGLILFFHLLYFFGIHISEACFNNNTLLGKYGTTDYFRIDLAILA